jgi:hypothetical protein
MDDVCVYGVAKKERQRQKKLDWGRPGHGPLANGIVYYKKGVHNAGSGRELGVQNAGSGQSGVLDARFTT